MDSCIGTSSSSLNVGTERVLGRLGIGETMNSCIGTTPRNQIVLLFFFVVLSFLICFCNCTDPTYLYHICSNRTLYTSNRTYQSNLNTLFSSLSSNANPTSNSNNPYNNATVGQNFNTICGQYFCRDDLTSDVYRNCVNFAA